MTRIIIIAGATPRCGRTQLGINMALELVRRGRQAGYYQAGGGSLPVERLLGLPPSPATPERSARGEIIRRGYQGADIILPRVSLSRWSTCEAERLGGVRAAHEALPAYDDFLIDLSGVTPRAVVACCRLAPLALVLLTPDPRSLPGTFAMLKVLQLNDATGGVRLVVNAEEYPGQADELHARLSGMTAQYLNLELPLLAAFGRSSDITRAERLGQAFSSIYPEAQATRQLVRLVDVLDGAAADPAAPVTLAAFWQAMGEAMERPVVLPGGAVLEDHEPARRAETGSAAAQDAAGSETTTLLRFEGPLARLDHVIQGFSGVLHLVADDMLLLHDHLAEFDVMRERAGDWSVLDNRTLEMMLARVLNTLIRETDRHEQVCLQVEESPVDGQHENWLRAGSYIKYIFLLPGQGAAIGRISGELERLPDVRHSQGEEGECICEALSATRDACLSVINTPQGEVRVYFWHQPGDPAREGVRDHVRGALPDYPANERLH